MFYFQNLIEKFCCVYSENVMDTQGVSIKKWDFLVKSFVINPILSQKTIKSIIVSDYILNLEGKEG